MSCTAGNHDETALLSYAAPYNRRVIWPVQFNLIIFAAAMSTHYFLSHRSHLTLADWIVSSLIFTLGLALFQMPRVVIKLECFNSGIVLYGYRGRSYRIPWDKIKKLRVSRHPFWKSCYLSATGTKMLGLVLIPFDVQERLASLINERGYLQAFKIAG